MDKIKVKLSLCLTKHHAMKTYWGSVGIAPRILDLGTRWRSMVSFTPRPLYPAGKCSWYPLDRRLGGPQSRSGRGGEDKNSHPPPRESKPRTHVPCLSIENPYIGTRTLERRHITNLRNVDHTHLNQMDNVQ
jgi:hypothetical protein